jgi:hypothetical protein
MNEAEAIAILKALLNRDADCRCGNMQLTDREIEAIKFFTEWKLGDI